MKSVKTLQEVVTGMVVNNWEERYYSDGKRVVYVRYREKDAIEI